MRFQSASVAALIGVAAAAPAAQQYAQGPYPQGSYPQGPYVQQGPRPVTIAYANINGPRTPC
jgi:hypothetical protein